MIKYTTVLSDQILSLIGGDGGGGSDFTVVNVNNSDYSCSMSNLHLYVDSSTSILTITFPQNPSAKDEMIVFCPTSSFDLNNVTINGNGKKINNSTDSYILDMNMPAAFEYHTTYGQVSKN